MHAMFNEDRSPIRRSHKVPISLFVSAVLIAAFSMFSVKSVRSEPAAAGITQSPHTSATGPIWSALPNEGLSQRVRDMEMIGSDLYAGGKFTTTYDSTLTDLGGIARYDTAAGTWNALPNQGLNGEVMALAVSVSDLYVAGNFSQTGDGAVLNLGNIAHFDTVAGIWSALPNQGFNGEIYALAVAGGNLYAGGRFDRTDDGMLTNLGGIARYDIVAGTWHAVPDQGLNGHIYELATCGSDLYAGGNFFQTGNGAVINLNGVARYDTAAGSWNALPNQGLNGNVTALTASGNDLYAGGNFTQTGDGAVLNLGNIAHLDTMAGVWNALPNQGLNNNIGELALIDADLYAGGSFVQTGDGSITNLGNIVRYDPVTDSWNPLPNQGLSDWVYAMLAVDSHLYVGGNFSTTGDGTIIGLNRIAYLGSFENILYLPLVIR
jgi:hypothetical protein